MTDDTQGAAPAHGEPPKYRLSEPAYLNDVHYDQAQVDAGKAIIVWTAPPAHYMVPLNAAAKAMVAQHPPKRIDPLAELTKVVAPPAGTPSAAAPPQPHAGTPLNAGAEPSLPVIDVDNPGGTPNDPPI